MVRSADDTEFYIPRRFLVDASPVLEDMCNARPSDHTAISIDLPEKSDAVETLLRLCHPLAPEPCFSSRSAFAPTVPLCWSYKLRGPARARVMHALTPGLEEEPVQVYVFAVVHDIPELMAVAAKESLRLAGPLDDHPELDTISGRAYRRLLVYRKACRAEIADIASYTGRREAKWVWGSCYCRHLKSAGLIRARWFDTFHTKLTQALQTMPHPDTVRKMKLGDAMKDALKEAALCQGGTASQCGTRAWNDLPCFMDELADEVDRRISEVSLDTRPPSS